MSDQGINEGENDNLNLTNSSSESELGAQITNLVECVEKNSGHIKNLKKIVKFLRNQPIESDDDDEFNDEENSIIQDVLNNIADKTYLQKQIEDLKKKSPEIEMLKKKVEKNTNDITSIENKMTNSSLDLDKDIEKNNLEVKNILFDFQNNEYNKLKKEVEEMKIQILRLQRPEKEIQIEKIYVPQKSDDIDPIIDEMSSIKARLINLENKYVDMKEEQEERDNFKAKLAKTDDSHYKLKEFENKIKDDTHGRFQEFENRLKVDTHGKFKEIEDRIEAENRMRREGENKTKERIRKVGKEVSEMKKKLEKNDTNDDSLTYEINELKKSLEPPKFDYTQYNNILNELEKHQKYIDKINKTLAEYENRANRHSKKIKRQKEGSEKFEQKVEKNEKELTNKTHEIFSKLNYVESILKERLSKVGENELVEKLDSYSPPSFSGGRPNLKSSPLSTPSKMNSSVNTDDDSLMFYGPNIEIFRSEINQKLKQYEEHLNDSLEKYADALTESVNLFKSTNENLDEKCEDISSKLEKTSTEFAQFKDKMFNTFVSTNGLDSLKQKHKNLKESFKVSITELHNQINQNHDSNNQESELLKNEIKRISDVLGNIQTDFLETSVLSREQQKRQNEHIAALVAASNGDNSQIASIAIQYSDEFEEMKAKVDKVEENYGLCSENIRDLAQSLNEISDKLKKHENESSTKIRSVELCSSKDREEFINRFLEIDEKLNSTVAELSDCPKVVAQSIDMNQMAISELSERVEAELLDMKSALQQANFADEEIVALKKVVESENEKINSLQNQLNERLHKVEYILDHRNQKEEESSKIWATIEELKIQQEVQKIQISASTSAQIQPIKIDAKFENADEEAVQPSALSYDGSNDLLTDIETLKVRIKFMEEKLKNANDDISSIKENIHSNTMQINMFGDKIRSESESMRGKLRKEFVDNEIFESFKEEFQTIRSIVCEDIMEQINTLSSEMSALQGNEVAIHRANNENNGDGNNTTDRSVTILGGDDTTTNTNAAPSQKQFNELKIMINGVDMAAQRQIRKLKTSLKSLLQEIEDAKEEEERKAQAQKLQSLMKNKKRKEEEEEQDEKNTVEGISQNEVVQKDETPRFKYDGSATVRPKRQLFAYMIPEPVRLPTSIELIQDDFQMLFIIMFITLLYFLVSDIFM